MINTHTQRSLDHIAVIICAQQWYVKKKEKKGKLNFATPISYLWIAKSRILLLWNEQASTWALMYIGMLFRLNFRKNYWNTNAIHIEVLLYLTKDSSFCPSSSEIYTVLTVLTVCRDQLVTYSHFSIVQLGNAHWTSPAPSLWMDNEETSAHW